MHREIAEPTISFTIFLAYLGVIGAGGIAIYLFRRWRRGRPNSLSLPYAKRLAYRLRNVHAANRAGKRKAKSRRRR